jgi:hypothetical protein
MSDAAEHDIALMEEAADATLVQNYIKPMLMHMREREILSAIGLWKGGSMSHDQMAGLMAALVVYDTINSELESKIRRGIGASEREVKRGQATANKR